MAWGFHGGASTAPGTAGGHYAGPGYISNQSPAQTSPYIKNEEEIKQDIIRAREKQLYGIGSSGLTQSMPSTLKGVNETLSNTVNPTLGRLIALMSGRIGNAQIGYQGGAKRVNVNVPLLNMGGGLLSGQGSWSPYGNNYLGFQYRKDW